MKLEIELSPSLKADVLRLQAELVEFAKSYNRAEGINPEVSESDWPVEKVVRYMLQGYLNLAPDVHNNFPLPDPHELARQLRAVQDSVDDRQRDDYTAIFLEDLMGRLLRRLGIAESRKQAGNGTS